MRTEQEIRNRIKKLEEFRAFAFTERMVYDLGSAIRDLEWVLQDPKEGS